MFGRRRRRARPPRPALRPEIGQTKHHDEPIPIEEMFVGGDPSPFTVDEQARIKRNEAAASLLDDDTMGYVVVRLKKDGTVNGSLRVCGHVLPAWRNHFRATLERIATHGLSS